MIISFVLDYVPFVVQNYYNHLFWTCRRWYELLVPIRDHKLHKRTLKGITFSEKSIRIAPVRSPALFATQPALPSAHWENQGLARSPTYFGPLAARTVAISNRPPATPMVCWVTFHRWTSVLLTHLWPVMSVTPSDRTSSDTDDDRHDPDTVQSSIRNSEIDGFEVFRFQELIEDTSFQVYEQIMIFKKPFTN